MIAPGPLLPETFSPEVLRELARRLGALGRRRLEDDRPSASVLVPLCHSGGRASVLFTKRSEAVGTHKGQVSFPGGRRDPEDRDEVDCALRELEEEVGLSRAAVRVLGVSHDAVSITGMRVTPVVAYVGEVDVAALVMSHHEIDFAFTLTLAQLADPSHRIPHHLREGMVLPQFTAGPVPVWGLTAYLLDELLRDVFEAALPVIAAPGSH